MAPLSFDDAAARAAVCTCPRRHETREACASVRGNKTGCQCVCHRRDLRQAVGEIPAPLPRRVVPVLVDSSEQAPWDFDGLDKQLGGAVNLRRVNLPTGDYSVAGLEAAVAIERKSLDDLVQTVIYGRERFKAEMERLRLIPMRAVIVEATEGQVWRHEYKSAAEPASVIGSVNAVMADFAIPVVWSWNREIAQKRAAWFLHRAWQKHRDALASAQGDPG